MALPHRPSSFFGRGAFCRRGPRVGPPRRPGLLRRDLALSTRRVRASTIAGRVQLQSLPIALGLEDPIRAPPAGSYSSIRIVGFVRCRQEEGSEHTGRLFAGVGLAVAGASVSGRALFPAATDVPHPPTPRPPTLPSVVRHPRINHLPAACQNAYPQRGPTVEDFY